MTEHGSPGGGWTMDLLDGFRLAAAGVDVPLTARKAVAVLAYLSLQRDRSARRDTLANLLWENVDTAQARVNLRQAIAAIRRVEAGSTAILVSDADIIRLADGVAIDVDAFDRLSRGDGADRGVAAELYRGDLLAGFALRDAPAFNEWLTIAQAQWRQRAVATLGAIVDDAVAKGDAAAGTSAALKLLAIDPFHEAAHRALMRLYARQGRAALALAQYRSLATLLRSELQVAPDAETQALFERIRSGRRQGVRDAEPPRAVPSHAAAELLETVTDQGTGTPPSVARSLAGGRAIALALGGAVLIATGFVTVRAVERYFDPTPRIIRVFPIATGAADERNPALSPDGSLVVFTEKRDGNVDLYLTSIEGAGDPVRLTTHPATDSNPSWRPDGRAVAFVRIADGAGQPCRIMVQPVPAGAEREVGRCLHTYTTALSWAPDGKTLYFYEDRRGDLPYHIHALTVATGAIRPVTTPPSNVQGDYLSGVSHDGTRIAFQRRGATTYDLAVRDLTTGETATAQRNIAELYAVGWSAGDKGLFYSVDAGPGAGLWWTRPRPGSVPVRLSSGLAGYSGLSVSASGKRMAVQVSNDRNTLLRLAPGADALGGNDTVDGVGGNGFDRLVVQARTGPIAFVSTRVGSEQLWVRRAGAAPQPLVAIPGMTFNWIDWSPNGVVLAAAASVDGVSSIYLIDTRDGHIRRIRGSEAGALPAWSGDGRYLHWVSLQKNRSMLVRISLARSDTIETVLPNFYGLARLSGDNRYVYFSTTASPGLRRQALDNDGRPAGAAELVVPAIDRSAATNWNNWVLTDRDLVYATSAGLKRWTIATGAITPIRDDAAERGTLTLSTAAGGAVFVSRQVRQNDITGIDFE